LPRQRPHDNGAFPDVTFATAPQGLTDFRFTMVGDEATSDSSSLPIAQVIAALDPRFDVVVGDLSYAGGGSGYYSNGVPTDVSAFSPGQWDQYLGIVGPTAARTVWQPIFDRYQVDLVVNGHVHAYERTYPIIGGEVTKTVPSGGTVHPATDGTTYIGAGGGGRSLYTGWYGVVGGGDQANTAGVPLIWEFTTSDTAEGGTGATVDIPDPVANCSAYRHANWSFIAIDVKAPGFFGGQTSMLVRAIDPTQNSGGITSTSGPVVMDSVTLVRTSRGIF
jgi:hypothetical protein